LNLPSLYVQITHPVHLSPTTGLPSFRPDLTVAEHNGQTYHLLPRQLECRVPMVCSSHGSKPASILWSDDICSMLVGLTAVAIWCTISLTIRILTTMKRWSGVYFYAILVTSLGISIRQIGVVTIFLSPNCPWVLRRMLVEVGNVAMISGFSTVLVSYSHGGLSLKLCLTFVSRL
jgi:hypothetical protein